MRIVFLTTLTMIAFAANSVLNRAALVDPSITAEGFALIRLASGALFLVALVLARTGGFRLGGPARITGVWSLSLYMLGFSLAYQALDAGLGALLLFGGVQVTMFAGALMAREAIPRRRWLGLLVAFAGLLWLLWPGSFFSGSPVFPALMLAAALGWGVYSLAGRKSDDPIQSTAANFALATLLCAAVLLGVQGLGVFDGATSKGVVLAVISGVVTSAMGYALWYSVLPQLPASVAAVVQLTVPPIAVLGGVLVLGEAISLRFVLASALVLGGVLLSLLPSRAAQRTSSSSGS